MNKITLQILLCLAMILGTTNIQAQCDAEIITDPTKPVNNQFIPLINNWRLPINGADPHSVNSFLNTSINWYPPATIPIDISQLWIHPFGSGTTNQPMANPFTDQNSAASTQHLKFPIGSNSEAFKDFRWEDGWELLWSNLVRFPNEDHVNQPSLATYFQNYGIFEGPNPEHIPSEFT